MSRSLGAHVAFSSLVTLTACTARVEGPAGANGAAASPGAGGGSSASGGTGGTGTGKGGTSTGGTGASKGGASGSSGVGGSVEDICAQNMGVLKVGRTRLRRLTRAQLDNTLRDLVGATNAPASAIAPDEQIGPFHSNAIAPVTNLIVQQHQEVAARVASSIVSRMDDISPCDLATEATCAREFIAEFGKKAYRRPLEQAEIDAYGTLFELGVTNGGASNGFRLVVEAMLQAPSFLYHADLGEQDAPSETPVVLQPYELASRLSYFVWNSMPDDALFALAESGELSDPAVLGSEVDRMLADDKALDAIPLFHLQWLAVSEKEDSEVERARRAEMARFSDAVVRGGDGLLSTLFTANYSFPEGPLFDIYGISEPSGFRVGDQVAMPAERSGLLTLAAFLGSHAHGADSSVVHRGIAIRENVLCQMIEPPPPDVMVTPLPPTEGMTARDRFRAHESADACAGCHSQMDPIGLAFENFDGTGAYRTMENGIVIDASGEIFDASDDLAGQFVGVAELSEKLAQSRFVGDCVANQWFRFSLGRMESADDACTLSTIHEGFATSGYDVRALLKSIVLSEAFTNVRAVGAQ
jgi:hypothetical protein